MAHLSLGVLGPLQVLIDDTPVAVLESDKVCALLVYLAVEADRPHRRESLVGLLWPDCPEPVARHNLRQALFNLRQAIGDHTARPPYLLISREAIQLNPASDFSLDLAQFNAILHACEESRRQGTEDPSIRAARLEELVTLYRGEFLQHFFLKDSDEFQNWTLVQRESLHRCVLDACSFLADYYEQHADFQAAQRHASRQLELDPWREEAHCQMMRALALDGQRSAALAQYETCRRVLAEELGVEPSANTRELVEQIRTGTLKTEDESPSSMPTAPIHNLPVSLTSFLGREQELMDLDRLLANPECRCISLVGPGGIGKTRLALQTAERHRAGFAHGVAFIPLAPVGSVGAVVPTIANAVHFHFYGPSDPKVQLLSFLCEKQMLLVLDNVEQLLEGPPEAKFVELMLEILRRAPGVKLLVTSREVLNLQGEWVFGVGGLAFPDTEQTEGLDDYAAVALFIQRGRRASPAFAFNEIDLAAIAHVCRLVEGMPLAIELAATWLRTLTPAETAQEIESGLDVLSASVRDLPERHRSMRVVFDQTWRTLSAKEQQVLSQLSVFRGGFSRQAAEQVAGASLPVLSTLVNRTLLRRAAAGRYQLHELVRQYSTTHLVADPEAHAVAQKRHYDYFLALAEAARAQIRGPEQSRWLERLERDHDNIRAALAWSTHPSHHATELGLRLCSALGYFWDMHGHASEGRRWLQAALELPAVSSSAGESPDANLEREAYVALRTKVLVASGGLAKVQGDYKAALAFYREALFLSQQTGDKHYVASCHMNLGNTVIYLGDYAQALVLLEQALALYRELQDKPGIAVSLVNVGFAAMSQGDYPSARAYLLECVSLRRELGDKFGIALALGNLGEVALAEQDYASAQSLLEESLNLRREIGDERGIAFCLIRFANLERARCNYPRARDLYREGIILYRKVGDRGAIASALQWRAELHASTGQVVQAVRLWSAAEMVYQILGAPILPSYRSHYEQVLASARSELGEETFQQAWAEGRAMNFDQAIDFALSDSDP